jgi:phage tail sheath protein FI
MALTLKTPGVYIQEIQTLPASVAQVETAIPAFLGYTSVDPGKAVRISSMVEYEENFGGPYVGVTIPISGTTPNLAVGIPVVVDTYFMFESLQMYFANGGGPCYVISTGVSGSGITDTDYTGSGKALEILSKEDEPTLIVMPELRGVGNAAGTTGTFYTVVQQALAQCNELQDRFTIIDVYEGKTVALADPIAKLRDNIGTQYLKYGAAYYPELNTTLSHRNDAIKFSGGVYNGQTLAAVETLAATPVAEAAGAPAAAQFLLEIQTDLSNALGELSITLPPSCAMAGVYARVDNDRGVWKAPANVSLNNVSDPAIKISHEDQEDMNVSTTGKSVNAIRTFTGKGVLVWGARTLAGNDNEWRYVPVRRLFITMEESISKATEFVVFEPNDKNTWVRVKAMIENYLTGLWRQGALAGAKPKDAFFVNVGLGETMTAQDILEGKLIVEVGVAAVRPAEFIILNFSHKLQES